MRPTNVCVLTLAMVAAMVAGQMDFDEDGRLMHEPPLPPEPDLRPLCERGHHLTTGGVTRGGGDGSCARPLLSQLPDGPDDRIGLIIAPLLEMEFFAMTAPHEDPDPSGGWEETDDHENPGLKGGPWGLRPRLIHRNHQDHFDSLGVPDASHIEDMLDILDHHPNAGPGGGGLGKHGTHIRVMRRRKGRVVSPYGRGQSVASDEALRHYKHDNHTISILRADERFDGLAELASGLENDLVVPVSAEYHVTPPGSEPRNAARTHSDTFVLHIGSGPLVWQLWPPPSVFPHMASTEKFAVGDDNAPLPPQETSPGAEIPYVVRQGDTLYIPPGWVSFVTANATFLSRPSAYLTISLDATIATWEGVLHALAILSAPASTSLQTTIMEGGARGCESITMLQVMTWAIRGISMRRAYLRGRVPLGKMSQHALFDMRGALEFSAGIVRDHASPEDAWEAMRVSGGKLDPLMASALDSATCSNPWSAFGDDQAGEVLRLRADELFPDAVAHIVRGAEEHSGTSFDKVLEWSLASVKERQVARFAGLEENGVTRSTRKKDDL